MSGAYLGQWGSEGAGDGQFEEPLGVALDVVGDVYVADSQNQRVQKFSGAGAYLTQFGTPGSGNGQLNTASGVAVDASGLVYVTDTNNHRAQKSARRARPSRHWTPTPIHRSTGSRSR